jgi:hypothetical protein
MGNHTGWENGHFFTFAFLLPWEYIYCHLYKRSKVNLLIARKYLRMEKTEYFTCPQIAVLAPKHYGSWIVFRGQEIVSSRVPFPSVFHRFCTAVFVAQAHTPNRVTTH